MTDVIDLRHCDEPRDVIHRACQLLAEGQVVGLPTETGYVAAAQALNECGIANLTKTWDPAGGERGVLALKHWEEAFDYVTPPPAVGMRLARRCWPGPVTLAFAISNKSGLLEALPERTRAMLAQQGRLALRVPAQPRMLDVLQLTPGPLVLSPESARAAATASELAQRQGELALVIDDGPVRFPQGSTVVAIHDEQWEIQREGAVARREIEQMTSKTYLFVCTGNTCRSPMAAALFRKILAEKLQCAEEELARRGFASLSAGLAAQLGSPASPEGVELLAREGIDLSGHTSQPLTDQLLDRVDCVYTMTGGHRAAILAERPDAEDRVWQLGGGTDISDPIGGGMREYEQCKAEIERHVRTLVEHAVR